MHKSSLLEIIRTFSPKELTKFEDFVNSPYFNKNKNVINLFIEIKKHSPGFDNEKLGKEKIWEKLFPEKDYNYGIIKNLIFDLNKLAEQFIVSQNFAVDEPAHCKYLLNGLLDKYLPDYFYKKIEGFQTKFDLNYFKKNNCRSTEYFNFRSEMYDFNQLYTLHVNKTYSLSDKINLKAANIMSEFLVMCLKVYNDIIAVKFNEGSSIDDNPVVFFLRNVVEGKMNSIMDNLKKFSIEGHDVIKLYHQMFESQKKDGNENSYFTFKENVLRGQNVLSDLEIRSLHNCLINSYVNNPPAGTNPNYELLDIFDSMIDKNIIKSPSQKWIEEHIFSYYIMHCANVNRGDKIRTFVERYQNSLNPETFENMNIEIKCILNFIERNFVNSLRYLNELEIKAIGKKILSKSLRVKILYEMNDYESFICEKDTYKHFLTNNKTLIDSVGMNEKKTSLTKNYIEIINNLFSLRNDFKKEKYFEVKDLIMNSYSASNWFHDKIKEIEQANGLSPKTKSIKVKGKQI
ncbi:MAG: hypothetical protein ABIY50_08945 [Ignavibacteria bacterium]